MGLFKDCGCGCNGQKQRQKFMISLMSGLLFFVIANPETYRLMRAILGKWVAGPTGCPSVVGLILHTVVFTLVVWGMMNIKKEKYEPFTFTDINMKPLKAPNVGPSADLTAGPSAPPRMAEAPSPMPDFGEEPIMMKDTGRMFDSIDLSYDVDMPIPNKKECCPCNI
jgi:hypothetical protein